MPTTEFATLSATATGTASLVRAPWKVLAIAGVGVTFVVRAVVRSLSSTASNLAGLLFKRLGAGWATIVHSERKWQINEIESRWSIDTDTRFSFTAFGD